LPYGNDYLNGVRKKVAPEALRMMLCNGVFSTNAGALPGISSIKCMTVFRKSLSVFFLQELKCRSDSG
jgi:hypothetical protein